jgi:ABC-type nitrate/sulfonate/bicarbonate transport system substrate-binding protein
MATMMRRRATLALLATALVAVGGVAAHGGLHGTHTTPRTQVVGNGEVVVDAVALNQEGYVVVRLDDQGGNTP